MGVFMNKLLGLTIIFSIISVFSISAMEEYPAKYSAYPEGAMPQYIIDEINRENEAKRLRDLDQAIRENRATQNRQYWQQFRQQQEQEELRQVQEGRNQGGYQPLRRRLLANNL